MHVSWMILDLIKLIVEITPVTNIYTHMNLYTYTKKYNENEISFGKRASEYINKKISN